MDTLNSRPVNVPRHRSRRPIRRAAGNASSGISPESEEELRTKYIELIDSLMRRMEMDGIDRMLDVALKHTNIA